MKPGMYLASGKESFLRGLFKDWFLSTHIGLNNGLPGFVLGVSTRKERPLEALRACGATKRVSRGS